MRIGILGSGLMGGTLGTLFARDRPDMLNADEQGRHFEHLSPRS